MDNDEYDDEQKSAEEEESDDEPSIGIDGEAIYPTMAPYVRDRGDAQMVATLNRFGRENISCSTGCPAGNACYPAGDGCFIGQRRPDRSHCCMVSTQDSVFLKAVHQMYQHATNHGSAASVGFVRGLGSLLPNGPFIHISIFLAPMLSPRLDFEELERHNLNMHQHHKLQLVKLGSKLFHRFLIIFDSLEMLNTMDQSIREKPGVFCSIDIVDQGPPDLPVEFLKTARNIRLTIEFAINGIFSESHLFAMIASKLQTTGGGRRKAVIDVGYSQVGTGDFGVVVQALFHTTFRGSIVCGLHAETVVQEGQHGNFTVAVVDPSTLNFPDEPPDFSNIEWFDTRALVITSN